VPVLRARLARKPNDARELATHERAEHDVGAVRRDPRFGRRQRARRLVLGAGGERVGILGETAQAQRAIGRRVGGRKAPDQQLAARAAK
jgi:hypothetical protein